MNRCVCIYICADLHMYELLWIHIYIYTEREIDLCMNGRVHIYIFTNPSARTGYDTRSIFKRSLTGLNSEFSFS